MRAITITAAAMLALTGCGGDAEPANTAQPAPTTTTTTTAPTPNTTPATAKRVVDQIDAAGVPLIAGATQDENTDPNDKLGRPGGYTSRASADLPGGNRTAEKHTIDRGLVVEVFATETDADTRAESIQDALKDTPALGEEWHYRPKDRRVLVRVSGKVKPSMAKQVETVVSFI
ncbi:hypothetical protein [Pilimelia columellifera]|uniref:Lipoprotein n=1 Tax=Pilimelia columellifera subsp. columellifera TaxID=706583 RepID=A0ABP6B1N2_9ACTN